MVGRVFFLVLGMSLAGGFALVWVAGHPRSASTRPDAELTPLSTPWGRLDVTRMMLEKPAEMLPAAGRSLDEVRWQFSGRGKDEVADFLASCGLSEPECDALMTASGPMLEGVGWVITPSPELVLALDPAVREKLYAELEKSSLNDIHQAPFCVRREDADIWFSRVGLPQEKVDLLLRLTYRRGHALCFCDTAVAQHFLSPEEFGCLVRALYSTPTLLVRLLVMPDDPIDALAAYWGRGGRRSTVQAMLESVSHVPGGAAINVAYLLPSLPRSWLCSYPEPAEAGRDCADCYYSSLNFFRKKPEERFLEPDFRHETFRRDYLVVTNAEQLGDIIVLVGEDGLTRHACVYIADDIVFTKNGVQRTHPWVLMHLGAVQAIYARQAGASQIVFRRRGLR